VEGLLGSKLPPSAYGHRSWWANDYISHVQSREWLDAGWRVSTVDAAAEHVVFTRVKDREVAYKAFFDALLDELRREEPSSTSPPASQGRNWQFVGNFPEGSSPLAYFAFSFAQRRRFRAELYIGRSHHDRNKAVFDALRANRVPIELSVGEPLEWERLDHRSASRVALYRSGTIEDDAVELESLRVWAVSAMRRLRPALEAGYALSQTVLVAGLSKS
jgi:hypothetical protein